MNSRQLLPLPTEGFVRAPQVLQMFPFSRTTLWRRVNAGEFPKPHKLGPKTTVWDVEELRAFKESVSRGERHG